MTVSIRRADGDDSGTLMVPLPSWFVEMVDAKREPLGLDFGEGLRKLASDWRAALKTQGPVFERACHNTEGHSDFWAVMDLIDVTWYDINYDGVGMDQGPEACQRGQYCGFRQLGTYCHRTADR